MSGPVLESWIKGTHLSSRPSNTYIIIYQWLKWTFPIMGELNMLPIVTSTIWKLGMNAIKRGWKLEKCKNVLIQEHYKIYNIIIYKRGWMVKKKGNQHISMKWCCIMFIVDHTRKEKEREVREKWCVLGTKKSQTEFEKVLRFCVRLLKETGMYVFK
jgi:hypothetical protein